ncbi:hypothetical protein GPB2148_2497 [marine gamma proteobacterium HTCC2148]|nr:hypothetical protein GPB2148_2497 [marine gamma proteobacterium HTCC2148]
MLRPYPRRFMGLPVASRRIAHPTPGINSKHNARINRG